MALFDWSATSAGDLSRDLVYGDVKTGKTGLKTCDLKLFKEIPMKLILQTPKMRMPFGVSCYQGDLKTSKLQLEFIEGSPFHAFCLMLDEANLKQAVKVQSVLLESRNKKPELLAEKQFKLVTEAKSGGYPPSLKAKVPYNADGNCTVIVVDEEHTKHDIDAVPKKGEAIAIIEFTGLWATSTGWGMTTRLLQLKFFEPAVEAEAELLFQ